MTPVTLTSGGLIDGLIELGYRQREGNRFARLVHDVSVGSYDAPPEGRHLAAFVLKGLATGMRTRDTDLIDIWRCLEVMFSAVILMDQVLGSRED